MGATESHMALVEADEPTTRGIPQDERKRQMNKAKWIIPAVLATSLVAGVALARGGDHSPRMFDRVDQTERENAGQKRSEAARQRVTFGQQKRDEGIERAQARKERAAEGRDAEPKSKAGEQQRYDKERAKGLEHLFQRLDDNGDGSISEAEAGPKAQGLLRRLDINHDGVVTSAETQAVHAKGPKAEKHFKDWKDSKDSKHSKDWKGSKGDSKDNGRGRGHDKKRSK